MRPCRTEVADPSESRTTLARRRCEGQVGPMKCASRRRREKLEGGYGLSRNPLMFWSGRPDSNRRRPAWEAGILPLNYGRPAPPILLLERHGERLDDLVAPRFPVDPLADSVQIELLVERHRGRLLDPE